jgi:hypothetical protein
MAQHMAALTTRVVPQSFEHFCGSAQCCSAQCRVSDPCNMYRTVLRSVHSVAHCPLSMHRVAYFPSQGCAVTVLFCAVSGFRSV